MTESRRIVLQRDARTYTLACLYFYVRRNLRWNTLVGAVQRLRSVWKSVSANGRKKYKPSFMLVLVTAAPSLIKDLPANDYEKETWITFVNYFIAMYQPMLKIMKFWEEMYLKHLSDLFATVPLWGRQLFIVWMHWTTVLPVLPTNQPKCIWILNLADEQAMQGARTSATMIWNQFMWNIPGPAQLGLTHWGRDNMPAISQTTLSNAFSWMKIYEFRLRFHWCLFLRFQLTIFQHWFR